MDLFTQILGEANNFLYSKFLIVLLIVVGVYFTIRTGFVQIRMIPEAIRVLGEKSNGREVSSFQALMISTASRVGTGNIAGVATAIVLGGAGAVIWMWIMAIIGGASAFIESTLAQVYKTRDGDDFRGGPAYYIERAMGMRWLGIVFALLLIACFTYGFNGLQSYTMTSAFEYYFGESFSSGGISLIVGAIITVCAGVIFFGGTHRIGTISSILVPIMAIVYVAVGIVIFFMNITEVPTVLREMVRSAFDFNAISGGAFNDGFSFEGLKAMFGGFAGSCVVIGIKRGLFSNEAAMGSAPNAAAAATVSHPAKQGLVQMLSVFIDTLIICSTTAFVVLLSGKMEVGGTLTALPLVQQSVAAQFGNIGIHFVTISICLFAFTSLIGNYFYAEANVKFISEHPAVLLIFRLSAVAMVMAGSQLELSTAWDLADVLMGGMATVNIIAIFALGGIAIKVLKDYQNQKAKGLDPVFKAERIGLYNTDLWK